MRLDVDPRAGHGRERRRSSDGVDGLRIGVVAELRATASQPDVLARLDAALVVLEKAGATIDVVSMPSFIYGLTAYYLIAPAEASSTSPATTACATACGSTAPTRPTMNAATRDRRLRPRGEAAHHARHLRAVGRLLRRVLRQGAEGAHAHRPRLRVAPTSSSTCCCRRRRRRPRSRSAPRPPIRSRCT